MIIGLYKAVHTKNDNYNNNYKHDDVTPAVSPANENRQTIDEPLMLYVERKNDCVLIRSISDTSR